MQEGSCIDPEGQQVISMENNGDLACWHHDFHQKALPVSDQQLKYMRNNTRRQIAERGRRGALQPATVFGHMS